jgi:hypothetical protein
MQGFVAGQQPGLLGSIVQSILSALQYEIDYSGTLQKGEVLTGVLFTVAGSTATVSTVTYDPTEKKVYFFLNGGTIGDTFTILANALTSLTQSRFDYIKGIIVTNGGTSC